MAELLLVCWRLLPDVEGQVLQLLQVHGTPQEAAQLTNDDREALAVAFMTEPGGLQEGGGGTGAWTGCNMLCGVELIGQKSKSQQMQSCKLT